MNSRAPAVLYGAAQRGFEKLRDSYFVPIERLRAYDEDFAKLERQRILCETYFGLEAGRPLAALGDVRRLILGAARSLLSVQLDRPMSEEEAAASDRWEAAIRDYGGSDDAITKSLDRAVEQIERICRPHLAT